MSWSASLGTTMTLFPEIETTVMWKTQSFFALGYMLGSVFGVPLYECGGFFLPFLVVGVFSTMVSIGLIVTLPNPTQAEPVQAEPSQAEPALAENDQAEPAQAETQEKLR